MYKSRIYRGGSDTSPRDSGSESTPFLSSESRTSLELSTISDDLDSDLDPNPAGCSFKYGSIDTTSYSTTLTAVPKRPPPLTLNNELYLSAAAHSPCNVNLIHEKNYEARNIDLILTNENVDPKKSYGIDFTRGSQFQPDMVNASCKDLKLKQSSLVTIFSIWNTILGSSLLTMPWGIGMAGFFPGIILNLLMSGLCLYTAYRLIVVHAYHGGGENIEVLDLSRIYLGKWAEYIAKIFSIAVLLGATIAYWILMANFLYNSVNFIYDNAAVWPTQHPIPENISHTEVLCPTKETQANDTVVIYEKTFDALGPAWDLRNTVPGFLAILIFPLLNFNSTTFFTKFNSLGTVSIIYLVIFILIKSASWGINMDQTEWATSWVIRPTFPALTGMLAMSFFIHNIIISIMKNNRNQKNNGRDLTIAYILVTLTYIIVGAVFYICFPLPKSCIQDNLLNNFQRWDGFTLGARIVLLFQLMTVYPLLAYMLRVQLLSSICKRVSNKSLSLVLIINLILVSICILFATFMPYIGTIVRYTGALSGFIYVFTLPSLLHLSILKKEEKLTTCSILIHLSIPVIGIINLIAQFFITNY
ncbi:sodium-coupled neutral amino acid transporter 9-like [Cataglyphis hispanica]|uniref:sodium-coupled neutral amino acid transporter 9-like n=1 Tax=Cataglyphis hispanica TaxID=1086592 RepID=UPI00217F8574|nr:sodium-coupled neutral amino acid transporter 9-like [Cataglyphis hispanica]XP_050449562.1 sodium-coupled neutral amino acid transporter 9-like [Cataglyphis hispanica]XP_050449563.1 sodium-coupled neutral amino acid transporter 9-like [Cataglyphis hispanica]XP_050449564.1 sodium-coupled neutral amino acid transporter 9-like [Cataglyphis hispanica]